MARVLIQQTNTNLPVLSKGDMKRIASEVIDNIGNVSIVMREKNNIIIGEHFRLDAKPMSQGGTGFKIGDYKVDIQTVEKQKKLSVTVAEAFVSPLTPSASLQDLKDALSDSFGQRSIYRVT